MLSRIAFVFARLCVACFAILTASYCLLAYIPFTYYQIHLGGLLPWLSSFAKLQPYLYWPAFFSAVVTLPTLRNDRTRSLSVLFIAVYGLLGLRLGGTSFAGYAGGREAEYFVVCSLPAAAALDGYSRLAGRRA